ncbi:O-antigen ligase family protein [Glutamicibacter endophyticus]|uniref:O-antigen ligase family protein n=1 Tax=Glutamicibacter endophyticus TaxID=1522174 RepID=UPI003AF0CC98
MRGTITAQWPRAGIKEPRRVAGPSELHLILIWLMTVSSVVAWRQGVFYTGGADPVVVLKALLQFGALGWAALLCLNCRTHFPLGVRSLGFLLPILALSVVGALAEGNLTASLVLAVRVLLMALTVMFLARCYAPQRLLWALAVALAVVGGISAVSGLVIGGQGRLSGGIPPLSPNEIALLAGLPALMLLHETLRARVHWWHSGGLLLLVGILILSESRTALIGAACAAVLMVLLMRTLPVQTLVATLIAIPVLFYVMFYTPAVRAVLERSDSAELLTFNSRTISWSAVLQLPLDSWQRWVGQGLSMKTIPVTGQYWEEQVFDSSWISLLAQAGVFGAVLALLWVLGCLWAALRHRKVRSLYLPLLAFILVRSLMENGLIDAGVMFLVFFALSLCLERPSREYGPDWEHEPLLGTAKRPTYGISAPTTRARP